jgi:long-chain acyl-CoA synthetase
MLSWIHVLEWRAATSPDAPALSDHLGTELTYRQLAAAVERAAAHYAAAGIRPGDVVPIVAHNRVEWAVAQLGLVRAGALPAAINWRLTPTEIADLLELANPAAVIVDTACAPLVDTGVPVLRLGAEEITDPPRTRVPARPVDRLRGTEPFLLLHTSGTTGLPKLVPLTHQTLVAAATFMSLEVPEATVGARHLSALPLFHVAAQANLAYVLLTGGQLHILGRFEPAGFVDELVDRRVQLTQLVPVLIRAVTEEIRRRPAKPDLSHLVEIVYGASPIQPDLLASAVETLGCRFRQNYASTETGPLPVSTLSPAGHDPALGRLATAGRPSLGWEVRLGAFDEIQVRGETLFPGYWNNAAATEQVMTADGFYRTGDIGRIDEGGYLSIVDRLKDMIISGGENVYPAEVEAVLARHPAVADVAVIGIPDGTWGETVHAVIVPRTRDTAGLDTDDLLAWARDRLAGFKCPTGVTIIAALPRNATGKVLKAPLREPHWAGRDRQVS